MNFLLKTLLAVALVMASTGCRSLATGSTPQDIKAIPISQSTALEVIVEGVQGNDPAWVTTAGNVKRDAILPILLADKKAWDRLDAFYNGPVGIGATAVKRDETGAPAK